ncbi:MAG: arginine--tRNA ligase [Candidatus Theseobacter exili]|nr:arginine--tRNA ligase [Candidatus Theseobacter exili]
MKDIQKDLEEFGVVFDDYFSERELAAANKVEDCLELLEKKKLTYRKERALWFKSTQFGDDKDRVLIKSSGEMTYITSDIAYHMNKYERGYNKVVNLWGPDHHGYIPRIKAAVEAFGHDVKSLDILIVQLCTLFEGKIKKSMSTRKGEFVTLREILSEVGKDAARYFFVMRRTDSHLDFDLELAKKQTTDNPVYYVQYAHARVHSIFKKFVSVGGDINKIDFKISGSERLVEEEEKGLIRFLSSFTDVVAGAAKSMDPNRITSYLEEAAQRFHKYYEKHRVIVEDETLMHHRLLLCKAVSIVIRNGLAILGIDAPLEM